MTPEEIKRTMDFILESQANSAIRMDRIEEEFRDDMVQMKEHQIRQRETVDGLVIVVQDLLKVSANIIDRTKRLESRSDSVDETIKVLRELLEATLRRPDNPRQDNN